MGIKLLYFRKSALCALFYLIVINVYITLYLYCYLLSKPYPMQKVLFTSITILVCLCACKKNDSVDIPSDVHSISPDSAQLLSDTLKIIHYKATTKGVLPATAGSAITLKDKKDTVVAVNGGYVVIIPEFESGLANGYYVKVKGADTYFTIDLNQPMYRKRAPRFPSASARGLRRIVSLPSNYHQIYFPVLSPYYIRHMTVCTM